MELSSVELYIVNIILSVSMNKPNPLLNARTVQSPTLNSEHSSIEVSNTTRNIETPTKLLYLAVSKIMSSRMHWAYETTRLIPLRAHRIQERMKKVI